MEEEAGERWVQITEALKRNFENPQLFSPHKSIPGEHGKYAFDTTDKFVLSQVIPQRVLSFEEASRGLSMLGKDESGARYAYLMMTASNKRVFLKNFGNRGNADVSGD